MNAETLPTVRCGEVVPESKNTKDLQMRDTLKNPDSAAIDASLTRTDLLLTESVDVVGLAVDAAAALSGLQFRP